MFFSESTEQAWFTSNIVIIMSLMLHSAAAPFEDNLVDWCEWLSLVATLFVSMSGTSHRHCLRILLPDRICD